MLWRKVELDGTFLNNQNIILDNQIFNQNAGFNIITPLKIQDSELIVLVNRGWYPNLKNRETIPNINTISGNQNLKGHIADFPVSGIKLGNNNIETLNSQIFFRVWRRKFKISIKLLINNWIKINHVR